jgi:hypothetical protein
MEFPYTRICGRFTHLPPFFSIVQVHTAFSSSIRQAQISRFLIPSESRITIQNTKIINNVFSKVDAEWLGLITGLEFGLENGERCIALENSNQDVMQGLIIPGTRFYRQSIGNYKQQLLTIAEQMDWLGGRYITSRHNQAIIPRLY